MQMASAIRIFSKSGWKTGERFNVVLAEFSTASEFRIPSVTFTFDKFSKLYNRTCKKPPIAWITDFLLLNKALRTSEKCERR